MIFRDMNRRDLEKTFEADNLAVFSIPALEAIIYKTQTPSPMIDATVCIAILVKNKDSSGIRLVFRFSVLGLSFQLVMTRFVRY